MNLQLASQLVQGDSKNWVIAKNLFSLREVAAVWSREKTNGQFIVYLQLAFVVMYS